MEAALRLIIPKISSGLSFEIYPYLCKQDLLSKLPARLRGYAAWLPQDWRIVVVVDRDDDDCASLKQNLEMAARDAGLITRTQRGRAATKQVWRHKKSSRAEKNLRASSTAGRRQVSSREPHGHRGT